MTIKRWSGAFTRTYIKLASADIPAAYSTAKLFIYSQQGGDVGWTIHLNQAAGAWVEDEITWNNQPNGAGDNPTGDILGEFVTVDGWNEIDIPAGLDLSIGMLLWRGDGQSIGEPGLHFEPKETATPSRVPYFQFTQ